MVEQEAGREGGREGRAEREKGKEKQRGRDGGKEEKRGKEGGRTTEREGRSPTQPHVGGTDACTRGGEVWKQKTKTEKKKTESRKITPESYTRTSEFTYTVVPWAVIFNIVM